MKVLVTGANGFLGRGIVNVLINDGVSVVATDIYLDYKNDKAKNIECDLFAVEDPYNYFDKPDVVLHLAWRNGFVHNDDSHIEDIYKHYKFIKSLVESGISKISIMGSMHEIGFYEGEINDETPCNPMTNYGIAKNTLRVLTDNIAKKAKIQYQWLRGYYIINNTSLGNSIFSKIVKCVEEGKKEFPFTSGQNAYDFLDYDIFCTMVSKTVQQDDVLGIINICSGKPVKLADAVENFIFNNNYDIKLIYGAFPDRPYDSKAIWGNNFKIQSILNKIK